MSTDIRNEKRVREDEAKGLETLRSMRMLQTEKLIALEMSAQIEMPKKIMSYVRKKLLNMKLREN